MEHHMTDDLERRLRAARPAMAHADEDAFDADLLARVREQPIAARRAVPRAVAVPVAAGLTITATAVVMLAGGPGDVGGPSSASAVTQALRWLNPPARHDPARPQRRDPGRADHHARVLAVRGPSRRRARGAQRRAELARPRATRVYDAATDTIYEPPGGMPDAKPGDASLPPGDPVVAKVRILLQEGRMEVRGRERHNGVDAWAISLKPDVGRPVWTLWVSAADGKPLELRDPGRDANEQPQVIRWSAYEVLPGAQANRVLTLTGAHPSARVVHDAARAETATRRQAKP